MHTGDSWFQTLPYWRRDKPEWLWMEGQGFFSTPATYRKNQWSSSTHHSSLFIIKWNSFEFWLNLTCKYAQFLTIFWISYIKYIFLNIKIPSCHNVIEISYRKRDSSKAFSVWNVFQMMSRNQDSLCKRLIGVGPLERMPGSQPQWLFSL